MSNTRKYLVNISENVPMSRHIYLLLKICSYNFFLNLSEYYLEYFWATQQVIGRLKYRNNVKHKEISCKFTKNVPVSRHIYLLFKICSYNFFVNLSEYYLEYFWDTQQVIGRLKYRNNVKHKEISCKFSKNVPVSIGMVESVLWETDFLKKYSPQVNYDHRPLEWPLKPVWGPKIKKTIKAPWFFGPRSRKWTQNIKF